MFYHKLTIFCEDRLQDEIKRNVLFPDVASFLSVTGICTYLDVEITYALAKLTAY